MGTSGNSLKCIVRITSSKCTREAGLPDTSKDFSQDWGDGWVAKRIWCVVMKAGHKNPAFTKHMGYSKDAYNSILGDSSRLSVGTFYIVHTDKGIKPHMHIYVYADTQTLTQTCI